MLEKTRDSYNLDLLSQKVAVAGIANQAYAAETWQKTRAERRHLTDALKNLGFSVLPSQTNFLLITPPSDIGLSALQIQNKLKQNDIPLSARIVAAADVFDALTSKRPYKEAWSVERTLEVMQEDSGIHFDPEVIAAMLRALPAIMDIYDRLKHV